MSDGFLVRWARRKRDVRRGARAAVAAREDLNPPVDESATADGVPAPEGALAAEAEADLLAHLPSLADLTAETDLIPFLRAGVPIGMRNAALRKMWSVDPAIRDFVSEAREYAYDWNTPGGVPGLGPLLQSDDVKAMLGRLINREPDAPMSSDRALPPADAPEPAMPADPAPTLEPAASREPTDMAPDSEIPAEVSGPPDEPSAGGRTVATPRLRRHGGAMPI